MDILSTILKQHRLKHTIFPDKSIVVEINTSILFFKKRYYATVRTYQDVLNLLGY